MARRTEWMLACDGAGCQARYPAIESLRGMGSAGLRAARELAARDGWTSVEADNRDLCPRCSGADPTVATLVAGLRAALRQPGEAALRQLTATEVAEATALIESGGLLQAQQMIYAALGGRDELRAAEVVNDGS